MDPSNETLPDLPPTKGSRVYKTFLFTDILRSTDIRAAWFREFGDMGNLTYDDEVLAPHDEILDRLIAEFKGTVVGTAGDSYFVAFDGAQAAVQCAVSIQSELIKKRIPLPVSEPDFPPHLQIRIGLHTGGARELLRAGRPNYSDHTINIASRIQGFADGEQVLMSKETWNNAGLLQGITKHEWEGYKLKGVDGVWTLVEALWDGRAPREPQHQAQPTPGTGHPDPPFILPQLDVDTFTGRVEEMRRLEALLLKPDGAKVCSIVGLAGGGGIGKSALACHFAAEHRDAFPDGVLGLRVDGKNNDLIAREFARLCGEEIAPDDERQAATIMQEVFGHRRMLLLFDNAEDAAIQELRPGGQTCAVIITTRDRQLPFLLGVSAEGHIDLPPLPPPDARLLLEELIGGERVANEPEAIEEIVKLIGSLPLALQIVGAMLHLQPDRSIGGYAASLLAERKRLEKLRVRGASHLDVLTSFSLSMRLLTDEEVDFFACQSVCAQDGFSLQAAAAAGACDEATAYERLSYLYRLSLLNRPLLGADRYVFHTLIRLFAQELSVERSLQAAAAERHARYFIQLVKANEAIAPPTAALLAEDLDDFMLAATWLRQQQISDHEFVISLEHFLERHGYWQQATMLMADFLSLAVRQEDWPVVVRFRIKQARYLALLGDWAQAEQTLVLAAETINRVEDHESQQRLKAMWFSTLGGVWLRQGRFDEAADAFRRSSVIDEQRGDRSGQAMVLNRLGSALQRQGRFDEAVDALQRSYAISEQLGDQRGLAKVLTSLGGVLQRQGALEAAAQAFRRSAEIEEQLDNRRGQAMVLNSLGGVLQRQGHFDEAVDAFRRSMAISEQLEAKRSLAMVLNSLGGVLQRQGHFTEAVGNFNRSYELFIEFRDPCGQAMVLNSLGSVLQRQGHFHEAIDALQRSYAISEQLGDQRSIAMVLNSLGSVMQRQGRFDEAISFLTRAQAISEQLDDQVNLGQALNSLGSVWQRQGRFDEAVDAFQRSLDIGESLGDMRHSAIVLTSLGGALQRQGRFDEAMDAFQRSLDIGESLGDMRHLAIVLNSLGSLLQRQGHFDEAIDALQRSYAISEQLEDKRSLAMVLNSIGGVLQRQGCFDEAVDALQRSYVISEQSGDQRSLAIVLSSLGGVLQRQRRFDESVDALQRSLAISEQLGDERSIAMVLSRLGTVLQRQGRFDEAVDALRRSHVIFEGLNDVVSMAMVHFGLGKAYLSLNDISEATSQLCRSFEINESLKIPHGIEIVTPSLVEALNRAGRGDEAQAYCRRALAVVPEDARLRAMSKRLAAPLAQSRDLVIKQGAIKRIIRHARGYRYGFIIPDSGGDLYFQERDVHPDALPSIAEGARVEFEVGRGFQGPQAKNVRII